MKRREFNTFLRGWYLYKDGKTLYLYQKHGRKINEQDHYERNVYDFSMTKEALKYVWYTWQLSIPLDITKWVWKTIEQINKDITKLDLIPAREQVI